MEAEVAIKPASPAGSPPTTVIVRATPPAAPAAPVDHVDLDSVAAETFDLDLDGPPAGLDRHTLITAPGHANPPAPTLGPLAAPTIPPHHDVIREVRLRVDDAQKRVVPLAEWIGGLKQDVKPQLDAARRLGELKAQLSAGQAKVEQLILRRTRLDSELLELAEQRELEQEQLGESRLQLQDALDLAAFAHQQIQVAKEVSGEITKSSVQLLAPEQRRRELARMLSGNPDSEVALQHAQELLNSH